MRTLFDGIPLDKMSVSMTMNGAVLPVHGALHRRGRRAGRREPEQLSRDHSERHSEGVHGPQHLHLSAEPSMRIIADIFAYTARTCRGSTRSRFPATTCRKPGATADLELAYTLADGSSMPAPAWQPAWTSTSLRRASFFWAIGMNFFMEVAKLRAARLLWAKLMQENFSRRTRRSLSLRTHSQTSGWSLTAQDVYNNVVRTCIEAMAATQGHTQSLHTNALRRGARPADRLLRPHRAQHPAVPAAGRRHLPVDRSVGRQLLCRTPDARPRRQGVGAHPRGRGAGRHGQGHRGRHAEAAHRGGRRQAPRRGSTAASRPSSASTSSASDEEEASTSSRSTTPVRNQQVDKLASCARTRRGEGQARSTP
jgi:hypothetical protein